MRMSPKEIKDLVLALLLVIPLLAGLNYVIHSAKQAGKEYFRESK